MIQRNPEFARFNALHMAFLALTGNDAKALRLLERHIVEAIDGFNPWNEFHFFRYAQLTAELLAERKKKTRLRVPKLSEKISGGGEYLLSDLAEEFQRRTADLARRFDERNGNNYYSSQAVATAKWKKFATRK